jgi:hypothetical protein
VRTVVKQEQAVIFYSIGDLDPGHVIAADDIDLDGDRG